MKYGIQDRYGERYMGRYSDLVRTGKLIEWMDKQRPAGAPHLIVEYPE